MPGWGQHLEADGPVGVHCLRARAVAGACQPGLFPPVQGTPALLRSAWFLWASLAHPCPNFSSGWDVPQIGSRPPSWPDFNSVTSLGTLSPNTHALWPWSGPQRHTSGLNSKLSTPKPQELSLSGVTRPLVVAYEKTSKTKAEKQKASCFLTARGGWWGGWDVHAGLTVRASSGSWKVLGSPGGVCSASAGQSHPLINTVVHVPGCTEELQSEGSVD